MIRGSAPSFYCVAIPSAALSVSPLTITVPVLPAAFCSPGRWGTLRQLAVQNLAVVSPGHCSDGDLQCLRAVFGALRQWGTGLQSAPSTAHSMPAGKGQDPLLSQSSCLLCLFAQRLCST